MQAVRYHEHGGPDVLRVEAVDRPTPDSQSVCIEVRASAVNPVDTYFRDGSFEPGGLPWIPGSDVAGVVTEVGSAVDAFEAGDRVFATGLGNDLPGTAAEFVTAPAEYVACLPDSIDFTTGAAAALVGVTAWQSLIEVCGLDPADRCLVHGGSGGVGHLAVQLASIAGARVTTTESPEYHGQLTTLGANDVFDYRIDSLEAAVRNAGNPDVILDHRLDDYLGLDVTVAAHGGQIAAIGNETRVATFPNVPACRGKSLSVHHVSMFDTPDIGGVLDRLASLFASGDLTVAVDRGYDLDEIAEAHRAVLEESYFGKLVATP